ncbi:MAG: formylglycine-generating enzyme family protein [Chthonomonadales bacterium]
MKNLPIGIPRPVQWNMAPVLAPWIIMALIGGGPGQAAKQKPAQARHPSSGIAPYTETVTVTGDSNKVRFDMVPVKGGTFTFVDPVSGASRVVAVKPFWIEKTEVTWDQFDQFLIVPEKPKPGTADAVARPSHPYMPPDRGFGHAGYPAISLTYYSAQQYCKWLSLKTGRKYRLPTEVEWEFACRCGGPPVRLDEKGLQQVAWYSGNAGGSTHPVGKKEPNAFGLYDMLGNAGEWCIGVDGKPVLRGGSFMDPPTKVNCRARARQTPAWNQTDPQIPKSKWWLSDGPFAGFRVVREP